MQAGFSSDQVDVAGRFSDYSRISDEADKKKHVFHFCPDCGSQVFYTEPTEPDLIVVSVGAFADPSFPPPTESDTTPDGIHGWVCLRRSNVATLRLGGRFSRSTKPASTPRADRGRELLEAHPENGYLLYVAVRPPRGRVGDVGLRQDLEHGLRTDTRRRRPDDEGVTVEDRLLLRKHDVVVDGHPGG